MTTEIGKTEKRRTRRVLVEGPVAFVGIKDSQPAFLKNISKNGVCCISRTLVPEMTQVALAIRLPALPYQEEDYFLLECQGAVVRCDPVIKNTSLPKWEIGIFFTELAPDAVKLLDQYIASRS